MATIFFPTFRMTWKSPKSIRNWSWAPRTKTKMFIYSEYVPFSTMGRRLWHSRFFQGRSCVSIRHGQPEASQRLPGVSERHISRRSLLDRRRSSLSKRPLHFQRHLVRGYLEQLTIIGEAKFVFHALYPQTTVIGTLN